MAKRKLPPRRSPLTSSDHPAFSRSSGAFVTPNSRRRGRRSLNKSVSIRVRAFPERSPGLTRTSTSTSNIASAHPVRGEIVIKQRPGVRTGPGSAAANRRPASHVDHAQVRQAHDSHREMSLEPWSVVDVSRCLKPDVTERVRCLT